MLDRRRMMQGAVGLALLGPARIGAATLGDDGLHKQPWFLDSFLDMGDDLEEAAAEGKGLMVLFEQRACPYCRQLHEVNFARAEIADHIQAHYMTVQLDLLGAREVTDFDGEALEERRLAGKWGVAFTPTTLLFPASSAGAETQKAAEGFRIPGYFKPFHHLSSLEYVTSGAHRDQGFQDFMQARAEALEAQGIKPDAW